MPVGYFIMLQMASSNTLIQVMVPDALRGRTMAVYSMMFMGMAPIGALLGGALSDRLGASADGGDRRLRIGDGSVVVRRAVTQDSRGG